MSDISQRLVECFQAIFPELDESTIVQLSAESSEDWDSLATVNLVGVLEEEFDVEISADDAPQLVSFQSALQFMESNA